MAKKKKVIKIDKGKFITGAVIGLVTILILIFLIAVSRNIYSKFSSKSDRPDPLVSKYFPPGAVPKDGSGFIPESPDKPASVSAKVPILMYHYIEYNQDPKDTIRHSMTVNPYWFEKQLLELKNKGFHTITFDDLVSALNGSKILDTNPLILTFDDGYRDFYTDAFPLLKKYQMKATIYVVSDFLDRPNYMTADMLKQIATDSANLITIGAHTRHHASLPSLKEDKAWEEIFGSKTTLEGLLKLPVKHFAYPYGSYNLAVEALVKKAGFQTAVTTVPGVTHPESSIFTLSRVRIGNYDGNTFQKRLEIK